MPQAAWSLECVHGASVVKTGVSPQHKRWNLSVHWALFQIVSSPYFHDHSEMLYLSLSLQKSTAWCLICFLGVAVGIIIAFKNASFSNHEACYHAENNRSPHLFQSSWLPRKKNVLVKRVLRSIGLRKSLDFVANQLWTRAMCSNSLKGSDGSVYLEGWRDGLRK